MKIPFIMLMILLTACKQGLEHKVAAGEQANAPMDKPVAENNISTDKNTGPFIDNAVPENRLFQLTRQATEALYKATDEMQVNEISEKYQRLIHSWLTDSCHSVLDSVAVTVDRIEPSAESIYTSFSKESVRFYASINYADGQDDANQIVSFARRLPENTDQVLKFVYLGECEVGFFKDKVEITIRAAPAPLHTDRS